VKTFDRKVEELPRTPKAHRVVGPQIPPLSYSDHAFVIFGEIPAPDGRPRFLFADDKLTGSIRPGKLSTMTGDITVGNCHRSLF